jgi:DNA invertase Pin-like site-specific DNA recombinase
VHERSDLLQRFMHIGYARVSTDEQHTENQRKQLKTAGCELIYEESASGGRWDRPKLQDCLKHIRKGDVLIVWKLDRLTGSLADLLRILARLDEVGAGFKSLTESIDTTQPAGRLMMNMLGSFNQFEREIIKERTKLGLARARANGRIGGGRYKLSRTQQEEAIKMIRLGEKSQAEIAELFNVDRSTVSRMMKEVREKELLKAAR